MHENDSVNLREARMQAAQEQARYGAGVGVAGALGKLAPMNECSDRAFQDPLRVRVERRLQRLSDDAQDLMRIQALLNEHPEFEKFIELQNLLNRRGV